jgi:hypothetical protein
MRGDVRLDATVLSVRDAEADSSARVFPPGSKAPTLIRLSRFGPPTELGDDRMPAAHQVDKQLADGIRNQARPVQTITSVRRDHGH